VADAKGQTIVTRGTRPSLWAELLRRLAQNRIAVASGIFVILMVCIAILADVVAPAGYAEGRLVDNYAPPGARYLLGADFMGRDVLSRTIYGARVSLAVALVAATISLVLGVAYGLISGYVGGRLDNLLMRLVDFLYGLPILICVILLQVYFKALTRYGDTGLVGLIVETNRQMGGIFFLFIALALLNWLTMARLARGLVLSTKQEEYVQAAQALGANNPRIIFRHLLPNIIGPCIVLATLQIPTYILFEAFLSFIGLGVNAPTPSWGLMIQEGYQALRASPHVIIAPAVALTLTVLAFNFLGDGLRDALDLRLRHN
jgi:oligopeptide transport system permease protein